MPSTTLLEIADALSFKLHNDKETVFGDLDGYKLTANTTPRGVAFFIPVAGIEPENLALLSEWLEKTKHPLTLDSYDLAANFLAVYAKKPLLGAVDKSVRFLKQLTARLDQLEVPSDACAVCGEPAQSKALYMGMYAAIHDTCIDQPGRDFTGDYAIEDSSNDLFMITEDKMENPVTALAETMNDYKQPFIDDTVQLVAFKSVKGAAVDGAPYGPETVRALEWFLARGEALGFKAMNVANRAGYLEMGQGEDMVACVCHLDVVPAGDGWTSDPFQARIEDGKIIARGTSDDKGPALMAVYALKALMDDPSFKPTKRLRLIVGLDEESGSSCMDYYVRHEEIPSAGFTADAEFPAIYAEKGITRIELSMPRDGSEPVKSAKGGEALNMVAAKAAFSVEGLDGSVAEQTFDGKPAHASTPELGDNAIAKGMLAIRASLAEHQRKDEFLDAFADFVGDNLHGTDLGIDFTDESGRTTVNVGMLTITDKDARIGIDVRYPVTLSIVDALADAKRALEARGVIVNTVHDMPPLNLGKDSELIRTLMSTYNENMGTSDEAVAIGGGTYARSVPNIAAFGPGFPDDEHVAHQADEYISIEKAMAAAAIYRDVFRKLGS